MCNARLESDWLMEANSENVRPKRKTCIVTSCLIQQANSSEALTTEGQSKGAGGDSHDRIWPLISCRENRGQPLKTYFRNGVWVVSVSGISWGWFSGEILGLWNRLKTWYMLSVYWGRLPHPHTIVSFAHYIHMLLYPKKAVPTTWSSFSKLCLLLRTDFNLSW